MQKKKTKAVISKQTELCTSKKQKIEKKIK
jgi:hypothetical protein